MAEFIDPIRTISDRLTTIREYVDRVLPLTHQGAKSGITIDLLRYYAEIRALKDLLEDVSGTVSKVHESLKVADIPERLDAEGQSTISSDKYGFRVTISNRTFASIPADNKASAYEWLRSNDLGELITETVNASTLSATAKSLLEEGRELPEGLFKVAVIPQTSLTKFKPKG